MKTRNKQTGSLPLKLEIIMGELSFAPRKSIDKDGLSVNLTNQFSAGQKSVRFPTGQEETVSVRMIPVQFRMGNKAPPVDIYRISAC